MTREEAISWLTNEKWKNANNKYKKEWNEAFDLAIEALSSADAVQGEWISEIDTGTWMLKCSVCGCRVQEEKYRIAVGENATKCPYCGAELGLGGYLYDEYANRPSQADIVAVVRCKDCRWWQDNNNGYPHANCHWCETETPDGDDFCSLGERREK